ncbi:MAG: periplasmic heavy metal sensor [Elusimicrobiota bacterium]
MFRKFLVVVGAVFILTGSLASVRGEEHQMGYNMMGQNMGPNRRVAPRSNQSEMMYRGGFGPGMGMMSGEMMGMMPGGMMGMMSGGMMGMGRMGGDYRWNLISERLDLEDSQRKELAQKMRKVNRDQLELQNNIRVKLYDLNYEMKRLDPDESTVDELIEDVADMQKKMFRLRKKRLSRYKEVFTDEQWEEFQELSSWGMGR